MDLVDGKSYIFLTRHASSRRVFILFTKFQRLDYYDMQRTSHLTITFNFIFRDAS